jgi:hypothetical protein
MQGMELKKLDIILNILLRLSKYLKIKIRHPEDLQNSIWNMQKYGVLNFLIVIY